MSKFLERVTQTKEHLAQLIRYLGPEVVDGECIDRHTLRNTLSELNYDLTCAIMDDGETLVERGETLPLPLRTVH